MENHEKSSGNKSTELNKELFKQIMKEVMQEFFEDRMNKSQCCEMMSEMFPGSKNQSEQTFND